MINKRQYLVSTEKATESDVILVVVVEVVVVEIVVVAFS